MGNGKLQKQGEYTKIVVYYQVFYDVIELLSGDMSKLVWIGHVFKAVVYKFKDLYWSSMPAYSLYFDPKFWWACTRFLWSSSFSSNLKQFFDEAFVISGIIKVEVSVISRAESLSWYAITLTETLIFPDITKTESNNCLGATFHKRVHTVSRNTVWHCSWKSCIARATYRLVTNLADN